MSTNNDMLKFRFEYHRVIEIVQDKFRALIWSEVAFARVRDIMKFKGDNYYSKLLAKHEGEESVATKQVLPPRFWSLCHDGRIHWFFSD